MAEWGEFSQSLRKWSWFGSLSFTDPKAVVILPIEEAKRVVSIQYPQGENTLFLAFLLSIHLATFCL